MDVREGMGWCAKATGWQGAAGPRDGAGLAKRMASRLKFPDGGKPGNGDLPAGVGSKTKKVCVTGK